MKTFYVLCLLLISTCFLHAQTRGMADPHMGRTYTTESVASTPWPLLQRAERQMRALDFEEAFFTYESAVAQFPNSAEVLVMRGRYKTMMGMQEEANMDFERAKRINSYAADLFGYTDNRGMLNLLAHEPESAILQLSSFQKLNYYYEFLDGKATTSGFTIEELSLLEQLIEQIDREDLATAQQTTSKLLATYPLNVAAYDLQGLIYLRENKLDAAVEAFSNAIEKDPSYAIAWYNLGAAKHQLGELEAARSYLSKAIELEPDLTKAYFERAKVLKELGDKESAIADYDSIIAKKGAIYPEALLNRALTKKMMGTYASALSDLNRVIKEFPNNPALYKNRGNLYLLLNMPPVAIDDFTKAIELRNEYADAYLNRGIAHLQMFDRISGCADLEKSSELGHAKAQDMKSYFCMR